MFASKRPDAVLMINGFSFFQILVFWMVRCSTTVNTNSNMVAKKLVYVREVECRVFHNAIKAM